MCIRDRFYNGASRDGDSRGEIYEADDTEQSVENMIMMQLPWKTFTEEQHRIVKFCVHSLDQNGYLTVPPSEIAEALKAEVSEVEYIVSRLKELEPVGIFAFSLEECLASRCWEWSRRPLSAPLSGTICRMWPTGRSVPFPGG